MNCQIAKAKKDLTGAVTNTPFAFLCVEVAFLCIFFIIFSYFSIKSLPVHEMSDRAQRTGVCVP